MMAKRLDTTLVSDRKRSRKMDDTPLPEGWKMKHSRSMNGKVYYYNTVTEVSTWRKPKAALDTQVKLKHGEMTVNQEDKKQPAADQSKIKQSDHSVDSLSHRKLNKDSLASPQATRLKFTPFKLVKTTAKPLIKQSFVKDFLQSLRNKTQEKDSTAAGVHTRKQVLKNPMTDENREQEYEANRTSLKRSHTSSERSADCSQVLEKSRTSEIKAANAHDLLEMRASNKHHHLTTKSEKRSLKYRPSHANSQNVSQTSEDIVSGHSEERPSGYKKMRINTNVTGGRDEKRPSACKKAAINATSVSTSPVPDYLKIASQEVTESRHANRLSSKGKARRSHDLLPSERKLHSMPKHTSEHSHTSELQLYESLLQGVTSHYTEDSKIWKESSLQGRSPYLSDSSTSMTQQTSYGHDGPFSSRSKNKNDSLLLLHDGDRNIKSDSDKTTIASGLSFPETWSDSANWGENINKSGFGNNVSDLCSSEVGSCVTGGNTSFIIGQELSQDIEKDIEDMEVDEEGILILSNLQDVRMQTSVPDEPQGVLTETIARTKPSVAANSVFNASESQIIFVVDTNILISCLGFLQDLLSCSIPDYGGVILVLPWVVLQELDYLKSGKSQLSNLNVSTSQRAAQAVKFIHSLLVDQSPQLIGQTLQEVNEKSELPIRCNDDRILQCCLQYGKKYSGNQVVLLTRDMNLTNKALIMGIQAASNETLWSRLKIPEPDFCKKQVKLVRRKTFREPADQMRSRPEKIPDINQTYSEKKQHGQILDDERFISIPGSGGASATTARIDSCESEKTEPSEEILPSKVNVDHMRMPQTDAEKSLVMAKFEAVWKLIFDIKSQIAAVLTEGESHANFGEAIQMTKVIGPILASLKAEFIKCLLLSPVVLWEHEAEFDALCARLNTFFAETHAACTDPSLPVDTLHLMKHFYESTNRLLLRAGLEQLSSFITDLEDMIRNFQ